MAALMQTSSFLGQSLKRSTPIQPTQAPRVAPVQAFFKKAEKEVKKAAPKGNATQVNSLNCDWVSLWDRSVS